MRSKSYFIAATLIAGVVFTAYLAIYTAPGFREFLTTCSAKGYGGDWYLAFCTSKRFGDYEHGAFYFDLEREAIRHLKSAQVLIFGNSRVQYALSNRNLTQFFAAPDIQAPVYLFGFGYAEPYEFSLELYDKFDLRPKVAIVAVDGQIFETHVSDVVRFMKAAPAQSRLNYAGKQTQQFIHRWLCRLDEYFPGFLNCSRWMSMFRSRTTGMWLTDYHEEPKDIPFQLPDTLNAAAVDGITWVARQFVDRLKIPKDCVIFITVPFPKWSPLNTVELAKRVGVISVEQDIGPRWATVDESHLTREMGMKFTGHVLEKMKPVIRRCLERL